LGCKGPGRHWKEPTSLYNHRLLPLLLATLAPPLLAAQDGIPDLIVRNASIYTADSAMPRAQAFAVKDGRFILVGSNAEVDAIAGPQTERLEAARQFIIPGMIDAHAHLPDLGRSLHTVNLKGTTSYEEVIALVNGRADLVPSGTWILGRGWDQNDWADENFPTHQALSAAVPRHPVYLERVDGHAALANEMAMNLAGLDRHTEDPDGGKIIRDADGRPTGTLIDEARLLVALVVPPVTKRQLAAQIQAGMREANRWGLTGIHDAGVGVDTVEFYEELAALGQLTLRYYVMVEAGSPGLLELLGYGPRIAMGNDMVWTRAIKVSADGAMGSRGAALLRDYHDDPGNRGLMLADYDSVLTIARLALENGFQLNVHAIGDRANRNALDAYEEALSQYPELDHRFRIEHAQLLTPDDIPRFAQLGVIPAMQGSHQTGDMYWVADRIGGQRVEGAYAWRSLRETGVIIPNGSDFPVEAVNPLISFRAYFTRQDADGWPEGGWFPGQRLDREEALKSITIWPAYAAFMENEVGSITAGKLADFVVFDRDIMTVRADEILGTRVLRTVVGGRTVYLAQ
jgi:predicted amidohydrolase YtcJ